MEKKRLVVGISGSSAPQLALALLRALKEISTVDVHLVISNGARACIRAELGIEPSELEQLAQYVYDPSNLGAAISSGSFKTDGMVIIPCSMHSLAGVASGISSNLVIRAADVCLKERRKLVLVTRETPLNLIHLRNMETVTLAGAVVLPPVPAFYHGPKTIEDLLNQVVGKVLDQFSIEHQLFTRWSGLPD